MSKSSTFKQIKPWKDSRFLEDIHENPLKPKTTIIRNHAEL